MVREEMGRDSEMVLGGRLAVQWEGNQLSHLFQSPRSGFNIRPASCELGSHKPNHSVRNGRDFLFAVLQPVKPVRDVPHQSFFIIDLYTCATWFSTRMTTVQVRGHSSVDQARVIALPQHQ
jgi:hypothetical protein